MEGENSFITGRISNKIASDSKTALSENQNLFAEEVQQENDQEAKRQCC